MESYDHTLNMFNHTWHPLTGEIPEYFKCTEFIKQAVLVIEKSRNIWKCSIDDEKFKIAQNLWGYIVGVNKRHETPFSMSVDNHPLVDKATVPQKCREIIMKTRNCYDSEVLNVSDSEIAALFAINRACHALKDYRGIEVSGLDMNRNRMFLENDIDIAETALGWALQAQPKTTPESKDTLPETRTHKSNKFRCLGDIWEIKLKEDYLQVEDSKYMKYIQYTLEHPLKKLSLLELDKVFELKQQTNITIEQQEECRDILGLSNNLGKITKQDNEDSEKYFKDKINKLKDSIDIASETGNKEKENELQAELDEILEHLSGGEYKTRIPNQKGRNGESILKGINRCIDSIKDASNKAKTGKLIAEHIDNNIERSKYHIVYSPEDSPNWNL